MVANGEGIERILRSKFLSHKPIHVIVQVLRTNASMKVIQRRFQRCVTVVDGVEMLRSATPLTVTAIEHFVRSWQLPCCGRITRTRVTDDHRIGWRPRLHRNHDNVRCETVLSIRIAATCGRRHNGSLGKSQAALSPQNTTFTGWRHLRRLESPFALSAKKIASTSTTPRTGNRPRVSARKQCRHKLAVL